jgi:hypothetical protein
VHCLIICLNGVKNIKNLSQDSQCLSQDVNWLLPEHKSEVLPLESTCCFHCLVSPKRDWRNWYKSSILCLTNYLTNDQTCINNMRGLWLKLVIYCLKRSNYPCQDIYHCEAFMSLSTVICKSESYLVLLVILS